jgi:hypothetical protein
MEVGEFLVTWTGNSKMMLVYQEAQEGLTVEIFLELLQGKLLAQARYQIISLNKDWPVRLCLQFKQGTRITTI